jgi:hypothetical protein
MDIADDVGELDPTDKGKERELGSEANSPAVNRLRSSAGNKKRSQGSRNTSPKSSKSGLRRSDEEKPDKRR